MNALIIFSLIMLLGTKAADVWTTKNNIRSAEDEQLVLGRVLFEKLGIGPGLAVISIVYVLIVVLYALGLTYLWDSKVEWMASTFGFEASACELGLVAVNCAVLLFVSLIQAQVAYCNSHPGVLYPQPMRWTVGMLRKIRVLAQ